MGRWEPNARDRLALAALELFGERGYEQTTVAEIAGRAGLTERTFFRHFADKREVLFSGGVDLRGLLERGVAEAPDTAGPIDAVAAALTAISAVFAERPDFVRQRHAVVEATPELRERELIKLASFASALTDALRQRGVPALAASLAAETGMAVFRIAFQRWAQQTDQKTDLARLIHDSLDELRAMTAGAATEDRVGHRPGR
ncbi:TetR/AcrR family transcriptional regulator [Goodfellowiella coeruleoviolacea]|uniref:Transcriptional regulator, TetR family n=1 Tax=Goodfellowiella coeruleoviolacea TaxID=334858 RepID=A0AAE3KJ86_9PSEU|nr:TetR/AcrR family transcriptional regulator [Goodfellowiella coeruleoviolacea]MCP2168772.1 transcriptional regulator, TetR family [Goodfellowiella coeruleoviolacea]